MYLQFEELFYIGFTYGKKCLSTCSQILFLILKFTLLFKFKDRRKNISYAYTFVFCIIIILGRDATQSQGCNIVQQQNCMAVEIVANENNLSPDYDEVRFSQLVRNSNDRASLQSSGDRAIGTPGEGKFAHFEGVGNAKNEVADYNRLLLRKKQSTCILINTVISEDEGYALLRTNVQKDTNADVSPDPKY